MFLLRSLEEHHLVSTEVIQDLTSDPTLSVAYSEAMSTSLAYEGEQQDMAPARLSEQRITSDSPGEALSRLLTDHGSAPLLVNAITGHITSLLEARDVEVASAWCSALIQPFECEGTSPSHLSNGGGDATRKAGASMPLDAILLFCTPEQLLQPMCKWLANDCTAEYAGEEARAVGGLVLFLQFVASAYGSHLSTSPGSYASLSPSSAVAVVLRSSRSSTSASSSTKDINHDNLVSRWVTALFGSEGISDDLLQDSPPHVLVQLTPTLFAQSIQAAQTGLLDSDTLRSGLTYFLEEPLRYTLPSAIFWLVRQIWTTPTFGTSSSDAKTSLATTPTPTPTANHDAGAHSSVTAPASWVHASAHRRAMLSDVLLMLLRSEKCPPAVRAIVAPNVLALPIDAFLSRREDQAREDHASIQRFRTILQLARSTFHRGPGSEGLSALLRASQRSAWIHANVLLPPCTISPSARITRLLGLIPLPNQDFSLFTAALTELILLHPLAFVPALSQAFTQQQELQAVSVTAIVLAALAKVGRCAKTTCTLLPTAAQASQVAALLASRLGRVRQSPVDLPLATRKALLHLMDAASDRFPLTTPPPKGDAAQTISSETHGWIALKDILSFDHDVFVP